MKRQLPHKTQKEMNIAQIMQAGANVQVVVSLADLKEVINEWMDEREAATQQEKPDVRLSAEEAAHQLGVTKVSLWRWADKGYLTPVKVGRKVFYWQSDIDKLLKKKEG